MQQGKPFWGWTGELDFGATLLEGRRVDRNVGLSSIGSSLREVHLAASHHEIFTPLKRALVLPQNNRISHHTRRAPTCNKTRLKAFRSHFGPHFGPHVGPHVGPHFGPHFGPRQISVPTQSRSPMSGLCCIVCCILLYGALCCVAFVLRDVSGGSG